MYFKFSNGEDKMFNDVDNYTEFDNKIIVREHRDGCYFTHYIMREHIIVYLTKEEVNEG